MFIGGGGTFPPPPPTQLLTAYNGAIDFANPYEIGLAFSDDRVTWEPLATNPRLSVDAGEWDSAFVARPSLVWDGSQFVIYYDGGNGTYIRIGRATSPTFDGTWTKDASNPVIDLGGGGDPDEVGAGNPIVHYDPLQSPPWKMWYHGFPSGASPSNPSGLSVCYADSTDGISWTKRGVVIPPGTGGAFNDIGSDNGGVFRSGSDWYVFMSGYHNPGSGIVSRSAYCIATDPADDSTYSAPTQLTNYTGNVTVGGRTWKSHIPRAIIPDGTGGYLGWVSVWNPTDTSTILESCAQVTSPDLTSWTLPSALMLPFDSWSAKSSENPAPIVAPV